MREENTEGGGGSELLSIHFTYLSNLWKGKKHMREKERKGFLKKLKKNKQDE